MYLSCCSLLFSYTLLDYMNIDCVAFTFRQGIERKKKNILLPHDAIANQPFTIS